jgi:hypothetical protein
MISELIHVISDPDKQAIKRAQMIRTLLQVVQVCATLLILTIDMIVLVIRLWRSSG